MLGNLFKPLILALITVFVALDLTLILAANVVMPGCSEAGDQPLIS